MTSDGGARIVATGLTRRFDKTTVVADVDLAVHGGEIHALIGANGAGKSTIVRILAGLMTPTTGQVRICGVAPQERRARARIGLLPSTDRGFYLRLSAADNLRFFGRLQGVPVPTMRRRIPELLEQVGLAEAGRRRTGLFSRGMLRRLAVARALLADPDVLLLDEATHDLDPDGSQQVRDLVRASGAATVWATQRLGELDGFADTVTILAGGRQRYRGPIRELMLDTDARFVASVVTADGRAADPACVRAALGDVGAVEAVTRAGRDDDAPRPGEVVLVLPPGTGLGSAIVALHTAGLDVRSAAPERPDVERALLRIVRGAHD
jgi:ABC-2 type transport system ATP-binding protein